MPELLKHFFAMGGYAFYVWTAYALVFLVLITNFVIAFRRHRQKLREIARNLLFSSAHELHP